MKRTILLLLVMTLIMQTLTGCCYEHVWKDATCTEPQTCDQCGETEGEPIGHKWKDATCTEPKTCEVCCETTGEPIGHNWTDATCTEPMKCKVCGATEGEPAGHITGEWLENESILGANREKICDKCGATVEEIKYDRNTKTERSLFYENTLAMTMDEFTRQLISYLPDDVVICLGNMFDDENLCSFSIVSSDLNCDSRYIRVWYAQGSGGSYHDHVDAYFDEPSDFTDIAECIFAAVDPQYVRSSSFDSDIKKITDDMNRKTEEPHSVKMTNGMFVYSYTAPYSIGGIRYSGFYEIRFLSNQFHNEIY